MENEILELLARLKEQSDKYRSFNEDRTKLGIVLPILRRLGWNTEDVDEVHPEFSVEHRRVDYALVLEGRPAVFIEVKRPSEDLDNESHEEQLLDYSFRQTVDLAVLTNGLSWSFYLPREGDDWRSRKFYTIDIIEQDEIDASSRLTELLSKANTYSGKALESAKRIFKGKVRKDAIRDTLPDAWNKIVCEPDSLLAELLAETTEKLCGFKPDEVEAAEFIRQHQDRLVLRSLLDPPSESDVKDSIRNEPNEPAYIKKYRDMLKNPNSLPSKIKQYIDEKGSLSYADLKKACVNDFGCKSETSGSIGASLRLLERDGHVRITGWGDNKMISSS